MSYFKNKKVIIFDLDGTIVKMTVNWGHLKKILTKKYNDIYGEKCEFIHISACLDHVVEKGNETELQTFFKMIEDYEMKHIKNNLIIDETIFFINNLDLFDIAKETKLAIFSLNTKKTIKASLKFVNIYDKFDFIIGREDVRKWKPNPDGLLMIKEHYNLKNKDLIYFGDLEKDVKTGNNAGIDAYLINDLIKLVNKKRQEI